MDFIMSSGIKVPNAVMVSGLLESPEEEEIIDFLKKYGSMRLVPVTDINSEFYKNLIIEYQDGAAIEALAPLLPYTHEHKDNPDVKYHVQALASVYTTEIGCSVTKAYLDEIKKLAKLSGRGFEEVLKNMMSEISETIKTDGSGDNEFGAEQLKVMVEHIVRRGELNTHSHFPIKLRSFSGKIPRPNSETDYDTWCSHVELLREDPTLSNLQKSRKIFESLLSPAADIVRRLSPEATPETYLQLLDAAFGTTEDGEELLVKFMNTLQDPGEKASTYLCRLQVALNLAVKRGGAAAGEADRHILKLFCRRCWDNTLLSDLNLEEKKSQLLAFSELLLLIRTEEDRQAAKATRMNTGSGLWQVLRVHVSAVNKQHSSLSPTH
uniref:Paraneoplastic antigen Ma-like C-terminal domain-containing protein n=1 Tax=Dicentrarchus labrax TaxID=13489 RepID=A0A8P4JWD8_DICLA